MIYKRWWFWVLVILIIGSLAPDTKNNDSTAPSDGDNTSVSDNAPPIADEAEPEAEPQTEPASDNINTLDQKTKNNTPIDSVSEEAIEYDALQQLYLDVSADMSYTEMIDLVKSTGLPYSEEKYNGSRAVQVAFTEGCTKQSYKTEGGDYLTISYNYPRDENSINDEIEKYYFGFCKYVPSPSESAPWLVPISYGTKNYITSLGSALDLDENMTKEEQLKYLMNNLKAENN